MLMYHGSNVVVAAPDVLHSRKDVDFGKGFYVTPLEKQAVQWALRFKRAGVRGIISVYDVDASSLSDFFIKSFPFYDEEWLDFVMLCRRGIDDSSYDIVEGGIANDKIFDTVELYSNNLIDKDAALQRLRFEQPNHQVCFRSQKALDTCLSFERSYEL